MPFDITDDPVTVLFSLLLELLRTYSRGMMSMAFTGQEMFQDGETIHVLAVFNRSSTLHEEFTVYIVDTRHCLQQLFQLAADSKVVWDIWSPQV